MQPQTMKMLWAWEGCAAGGAWQVSSPEGNSHAGASLTCDPQIKGLAKLERHQFFFTSNFTIIT